MFELSWIERTMLISPIIGVLLFTSPFIYCSFSFIKLLTVFFGALIIKTVLQPWELQLVASRCLSLLCVVVCNLSCLTSKPEQAYSFCLDQTLPGTECAVQELGCCGAVGVRTRGHSWSPTLPPAFHVRLRPSMQTRLQLEAGPVSSVLRRESWEV